MLQNIRDNSQGWIAKTIIGLIIVLLALTGFEAIFNSAGNKQNAAEVNGEPISRYDLDQAVNMQRRQLAQQLGRDFDAASLDDRLLRDAALGGLIDRTLLLHAAHEADFAFSSQALDQLILQTPEFQVDGKFSAARFDQVIQQMGYSRIQFRQLLEQEMLIGQLRAGISGTGFVTDQQVEDFARLEMQTRDFDTLAVKASVDDVTVSDEEIQQHYEQNADRYRSPEQVVLEYVQLTKDAFFDQVDVDEQALQELYEKQIANLAEQRRAAHILIETADLSDEQAKAKLDEIAGRLQAGEPFADLAKQFSQDPGSASEGGDLGFAGPGVYDPAFEEALYALKEGEVSQPVKTEFGWHLIKLLGVQSPDVPSLESLKPELLRELKAQQVEQRFVETSKQLEDAAFEASDLAQPAQELGLKVETTAAFGREGGEGIAANRQVIQAAFSDEVLVDGANSSLIELDPDTVVVVRAKQHLQPELRPLEEVREGIVQQLRQQKASEKARQDGEALLAKLRDNGEADGSWETHEAATRAQEGIAPVVLQAAFRMPRPEQDGQPSYMGLSLENGDYVVLRLKGVNEPEQSLSDEEKRSYRRFLASRIGQQDFASFRQLLQSEAKVERF